MSNQTEKYKFTSDFFSRNIQYWNRYLKEYKNSPNVNAIEIGSYEGRSAIWLLENILTDKSSKITCVDLFEKTPAKGDFSDSVKDALLNHDYYTTFTNNIKPFKDKVTILKGYSHEKLREFSAVPTFDIGYIDGGHNAALALSDAILLHPLMKIGGILIFDDYPLKPKSDSLPVDCPKMGIDSFRECFKPYYETLLVEWQVYLRRIK